MGIVSVSDAASQREVLDAAVRALDSGGVIAIPSDTGYALVADVSYATSADRLFALTKRTRNYELSLLVADNEQAMSVAVGVTPAAVALMNKLWPGPLTLVLPRNPEFVADLGSDDETVGVRCPDHIVPRLLCEEVGPLAHVGACFHGTTASTTAAQVNEVFGERVAMILDAGEFPAKTSTVVDVTGTEAKVIREGEVSRSLVLSVVE